MSIVGSVGAPSLESMQILQRLAGQREDPLSRGGQTRSPMGGRPPGGPHEGGAEMLTDKVGTFAESVGLDAETVTALQDQLDSAINAALKDADESADRKTLVDEAIASTIEEYGLDSETFLNELEASRPTGGPPPNGLGSNLSQGGIMTQMFSLADGSASGLSQSMSLLNALA